MASSDHGAGPPSPADAGSGGWPVRAVSSVLHAAAGLAADRMQVEVHHAEIDPENLQPELDSEIAARCGAQLFVPWARIDEDDPAKARNHDRLRHLAEKGMRGRRIHGERTGRVGPEHKAQRRQDQRVEIRRSLPDRRLEPGMIISSSASRAWPRPSRQIPQWE